MSITFPFLFVIGLSSSSNGCSVCLYSPWTFWSSCSASCGPGVRFRVRSLAVHTAECNWCRQTESERQYCEGKQANCWKERCRPKYGAWSDWTNCSVDCGVGWKLRNRKLLNSSLSTDCNETKLLREVAVCVGVARRCAGIYCENATWSVWEECSTSSGRGMQMRRRGQASDSTLVPRCYEFRPCDPKGSTVELSVENRTCSLSWTQWSSCSSELRVRTTSDCVVYNETQPCPISIVLTTAQATEPAASEMSKKPSEKSINSKCSLVQWLSDVNLTQYSQQFYYNSITMEQLMLSGLNDSDLVSMQVTDLASRRRAIDSIQHIQCSMSQCDISLCPNESYLQILSDDYNCGYCCQCVDPKEFGSREISENMSTLTVSLIAMLGITSLLTVTFFLLWRRAAADSSRLAFDDTLVPKNGFHNPTYSTATASGRQKMESGVTHQTTAPSVSNSSRTEQPNRSQGKCTTSDKSSQTTGSAPTAHLHQLPPNSVRNADFAANYDCLPSQYMLQSVQGSQRHSSTSCSSSNRMSCQSTSTGTSDLRSSLASSVISQ